MSESAPATFSESPVESYRSASLHHDPLLYPGERPPSSYITDGEIVSPLSLENRDGQVSFKVLHDGQEVDVNDYLKSRNAPLMADRIPVIAFGSNMCPGSLKAKFTKIDRPDALVVPTLYTELPGHDVVWSAGPGINGNFIAILYSGSETADTSVQIGLNFLTREQLLVLHATEMNYELREVPLVVDGLELKTFFYAGADKVFVDHGHPIAVDSIPAQGRNLETASTVEMLNRLLADDKVRKILQSMGLEVPEETITPGKYIDYVRSLKALDIKQPKTVFKGLVNDMVDFTMRSRKVKNSTGQIASWANPSTLPTLGEQLANSNDHSLIRLPNQELPIAEWSDPAARNKVLHSIQSHYRRHNAL